MKHWIQAFRLRTLPLSLSSIIMGSFAALAVTKMNWLVFGLSISTTVFLQILSNLANDYGDTQNGADHEGREGPSRAVQTGAITPEAMKKAMYLFGALSFVSGISLIYFGLQGLDMQTILFFFLLGIGAIGAAVKYTAGKNPYGYRALGDVFVFIFFGLVGVLGTFYMQARFIPLTVILPATTIGLLSVAVMNLNNMRDIESDTAAGKRTVASILGEKARVYHSIVIVAALLAISSYAMIYQFDFGQLLFMLSFPIFAKNMKTVFAVESLGDLDLELKKVAIGTFILSILFALGQIMVFNVNL